MEQAENPEKSLFKIHESEKQLQKTHLADSISNHKEIFRKTQNNNSDKQSSFILSYKKKFL